MSQARVVAVCKSKVHSMNKPTTDSIELIEGIGIKDDAHSGATVKHRYLVRKNPEKENLRQVHLIHSELHQELKMQGFTVSSGEMGENITTEGIDLLGLPKNTILKLGENCKVRVTGLRNPCHQLNGVEEGLMNAVLDVDKEGNVVRKAGIMSVVITGGIVKPNDTIGVELPTKPFIKLQPV